MNILIADSGSTKTDWALVDSEGRSLYRSQTQGLNPFHMTDVEILHTLQTDLQLPATPDEVYFYGSGVTPEMSERMNALLTEAMPQAQVWSGSDMLGAARAVLGYEPGIACIFGTGANSCLYDGDEIVYNVPPLGYILGDEGSGAVLGKRFLNGIFKGSLPETLKDAYLEWSGLDYPSIINKVYREPLANRYLASIAPFISQTIDRGRTLGASYEEQDDAQALDDLVTENFRDFFFKNITPYLEYIELEPDIMDIPVQIGCVGSIAYYFGGQLRSVCEDNLMDVADIVQSPMDGLIDYHTQQPWKDWLD